MKTALVYFKYDGEQIDWTKISEYERILSEGGISVSVTEVLPADDKLGFSRRLEYLRDNEDNLIVIAKGLYDEKSIIAETLGISLVENESAMQITGDINQSLMPENATLIPNPDGEVQGFMCEEEEFTLSYLPQDGEFAYFCDSYLIPYFNEKYSLSFETFVFKYFGDLKKLNDVIDEAAVRFDCKFERYISAKYGDAKVKLVFTGTDKSVVLDVQRFISENLEDRIYTYNDSTLGEVLFSLLKLNGLKLSVAESFTGGRVVAEIIKNSGASEFLDEGVVSYSNKSKVKRLGVKEETLSAVGAVSSKVAYQMAAGLLTAGECDIAVSTTGIAGPNSDNTLKPVGLNYIGVGMKNGVHVFKYELNGTREEITETAKNTALFLAIKNLKNYKG